MNVLLIGYKNHALRLLNLLKDRSDITKIHVYNPSFEKLKHSNVQQVSEKIVLTDKLEGISCEAVFIASPGSTHAEYVRRLADGKRFIFCEKPPAENAEDLRFFSSLASSLKDKLYFNFNYRFTELALAAKKAIAAGELGKPLYFNFVSTQGIAFQEKFAGNWRFSGAKLSAGVLSTVGIHYLDVCQWLMKSKGTLQVSGSTHSPHAKSWDTCSLSLSFPQGFQCQIFVSYAAPFANTAQLFFENGLLQLDNGVVNLFSPRDSFDAAERFCTPPVKKIHESASSLEYYNLSLAKSLDYFFSIAGTRGKFSGDDYALGIESNSLIV